jgi:DNA-binding transcriptional MocR family regulator
VIISPGRPFFAAEPPGPFLRLTFAAEPPERLVEGVRRLALSRRLLARRCLPA